MSQMASISVETTNVTFDHAPLPEGWRWVKLGDVCEVVTGSTPPKAESRFYGGTIAWIKPDDLDRAMYVDSSSEYLSEEGAKKARILPAGSVLVSCIGNVGKTAVAAKPLATNQQINSLIPSEEVDSAYLFFACRFIGSTMRAAASVSLVPIINKSSFSALKIPLPPLPKQKRIASILKEQMAAVERARVATEAQLQVAKKLSNIYLNEAFYGITPLTTNPIPDKAPEGWQWHLLTDLARLESGHTPSRYHPEWWGGDIAWIALPDIRALDGKVAFETSEYTNDAGIANSSARILPADTVVLSRTASVGFVTMMGRPMATSQDFVNWICGSDLDPHFLVLLLRASRKFIHSVSSGAVHKTVYMPTVKSFRVCVPSLDEQKQIASTLGLKLEYAERIPLVLQDQLYSINELPALLLRQAFTGKL